MEVIRRNTDYAMRIVTILARDRDQMVSSRLIAEEAGVSYTLTCKLLQKFQKKGFVKSVMGPRGGFVLVQSPEKITFLEIIEAVQGPIRMNQCLLSDIVCPLKKKCPLHGKLAGLQREIQEHLRSATFGDAVKVTEDGKKGK